MKIPPPKKKTKNAVFATEICRIKFRWRILTNRNLQTITKCRDVTIIVSIHKTRRCDFKYRYGDNENTLRVSKLKLKQNYNNFNQSLKSTRFFYDENRC